jgi:hypothetical protein
MGFLDRYRGRRSTRWHRGGDSYVFTIDAPGFALDWGGGEWYVWSYLPPEIMQERGDIPPEAVIGRWNAEWNHDMDSPVGFQQNRPFIDLMHRVLCAVFVSDPKVQAEARRLQSGTIGIIDARTPEGVHGNVPLVDVIGMFEVVNGQISPETYIPTKQHRLITENGRFRLLPAHEALVVAEVIRVATQGRSPSVRRE